MAITEIIAATVEAVAASESTDFTTTARGFWLHGDNFGPGEAAIVERVGPSSEYKMATNNSGQIYVSASPNTIFVDLPAGTYRVAKTATALAASVGYEEAA